MRLLGRMFCAQVPFLIPVSIQIDAVGIFTQAVLTCCSTVFGNDTARGRGLVGFMIFKVAQVEKRPKKEQGQACPSMSKTSKRCQKMSKTKVLPVPLLLPILFLCLVHILEHVDPFWILDLLLHEVVTMGWRSKSAETRCMPFLVDVSPHSIFLRYLRSSRLRSASGAREQNEKENG